MKRTFEVAIFGASDVANKKVIASLHRARGGELVDICGLSGIPKRFFDYERSEPGLQIRFRVSALFGGQLSSRAFLGLIGASGLVFVPSGQQDREAWHAARDHIATYGDLVVMIASVRPIKGIPGALVPTTGNALASAIENEMVTAFRAQRVKGRATSVPSKAYTSRANALVRAAEIALEVGPRDMRGVHETVRSTALHPELGSATVSSLATLETVFFTYWNEGRGKDVDAFWRLVAKHKLPFTRRDVVAEALERGRITNREDYDTITDLISDERLTANQRRRLDGMLGAYASRGARGR